MDGSSAFTYKANTLKQRYLKNLKDVAVVLEVRLLNGYPPRTVFFKFLAIDGSRGESDAKHYY